MILLVILALFVWMTAYFGYTYVKLVTQAPNNVVQAISEENQIEVAISLEKISFWTCQVGVFKSPDNPKEKS